MIDTDHLAVLLAGELSARELEAAARAYHAHRLETFVAESNLIEGIDEVSDLDLLAHRHLLGLKRMTVRALEDFVGTVGGKPLRREPGMNVGIRGSRHQPPPGGPSIERDLKLLLRDVNAGRIDSYDAHTAYETLHPFLDGNGRSGRAIWAWMEDRAGRDPFRLPFLRLHYYTTLDRARP